MSFRGPASFLLPILAASLGCSAAVAPSDDAGKPEAPIVFDGGAPAAEIDLAGCPQEGFVGTFSIGGEPLSLVVDTGSSDVGVAGANCSGCDVSPVYTPSPNASDQGTRVSITYASGDGWSGEAWRDSFGADGAIAPTRFAVIDTQDENFFSTFGCGFGTVPFSFQGIAGFGPAGLADPQVDDPMTALHTAGIPDVFAFALCDFSGKLWLGGYGAEATPKMVPLVSGDPFYEIVVGDLGVGTSSLGLTASQIGDMTIDSDTTELELPSSAYDAVKSAIESTNGFQTHIGDAGWFDRGKCTTPLEASPPTTAELDADLPALTFHMRGAQGSTVDVTLTATQSYIEPVKTDRVFYCPEVEATLSGNTVLGSAAMRRELVVIDRGATQVGFAPYSNCADSD
ncbi:MAG: pepsin-like aspartic protease [Polyangiaceae bacterium]